MPLLELRGLEVGYAAPRRASVVVAGPLDAGIERGELVCLLGPNGAGKSTLLRTIAGIQRPLAGRVTLGGDDLHALAVRERARRLGIVMTTRVRVGLLTGAELVAMGRHPHTGWTGRLSEADRESVATALTVAGADTLAQRPVDEMSDGERQRIMVARALAQDPRLLVLDEVTAFLDLPRRVEMMRLLRRLAHREGRTVLLSTHDLDLALRSADRIWLLSHAGEMSIGAPEELGLDAAFDRVFAFAGVTFDPLTGSVRVVEDVVASAHLRGSGPRAAWTRHALERTGIAVVPESAPATMTVECGGGEAGGWRLGRAGCSPGYFPTLGEFLRAAREIARRPDHD